MSAARTGRVFDISRGRVDDGPGLRTVVFLKGCAARCPWCHNPEGRSPAPEIAFDAARCIGCGACARACPRTWPAGGPDAWRDGCTACGRCVAACPARARRLAGTEWTSAALARELLVDADYFAGTGGGVTFSGGEPLAQPEFLFEVAARLRAAGVHVAVETGGLFAARWLARLAREVDLVLWDVKHVAPARLLPATGHDMRAALRGLRRLLAGGTAVELRLTLVPGFNDGDGDLAAIARWIAASPRIPSVRVLPFHRLAAAKQAAFARPYRWAETPATTPERVRRARRILARAGIRAG